MPTLLPLEEDPAVADLVDRLITVAAAQPEAIALGDDGRQLTFGELLVEAAAITAELTERNPNRRPVAVLLSHGVDAVVAAVAVVGSGAPLVVLDSTTPAPRLRHYVEAAGTTICLTDPEHRTVAEELCNTVLTGRRGATGGDPVDAAGVLRAVRTDPHRPLVVVFTSGSTGRPKGVANGARAVLHDAYTNAVATGCYGPGDVVANLLPMAFAAGIGLTLTGLAAGATQQLFDPRARPVGELPQWLRQVGATILVASPGILRGLVASQPPGATLDGLTRVTVAGETVHAAELAAIRGLLGPSVEIWNRYGSTETGLISEYILRAGDPLPVGPTPVGRPVSGMQVRVRDEHGTDHEVGTGRLVVTSRWLTQGYLGNPEATSAVFTDLEDGRRTFLTNDSATIDDAGQITLLGRTDHSVKVRGHLVEPGEIDAVLFAQPEIREAVTVGVTSEGTGRVRLISYVVPADARIEAASVRRVVREQLPVFMVPEQVVFLTALPRTERGKLDRAALPAAPPPSRGDQPPRSDWERVVAAMFARVLGLDSVGVDGDFFELGGDSLAAEELLAAVVQELDVPTEVATTKLLAEASTPQAFAEAVRRQRRPAHPTLVRLRGAGSRTPLFCVGGAGAVAVGFRPLALRLGPDQPVYAVQASGLETRGPVDWTVEAMAARHLETLRAVQPHGPYRLAGHSLGALIALDMAHSLTAAGEEVELVAVLDSYPPDPAMSPSAFDGSVVRKLKRLLAVLLVGVLPSGRSDYSRFHVHGVFVGHRHRGRPWAGRTLVVVAQDDGHAAPRARWEGHLTGSWDVVHVPGDHVSVLHEPYVGALADALSAELQSLDVRPAAEAAHPGA
ncbi:AMP-binding protein [Blastococcus tunisiensis]|uniref:Acyl-CoA synthetase (AMP-forming)/AMP-acid ligase II n=1 Tax=Blastococcus tunisiensis TaxID=1798228 RepID=A0A1I1XC92_9ACTN|nr:AMP-binding protein [Blastococcus sp. DSM 46838]SFE04967.1 Acyl-CoA synthetase (AMP-forming)/AMP-acid ligase II [Blastococcus sp. DSM 46838]